MAIHKTEIPTKSLLKTGAKPYDYSDSFQGTFYDKFETIGVTEIGKLFFSSGPKWIDYLFALRNKLVAIFGLKTSGKMDDRQKKVANFKGEVGEQLGLFKVFEKTDNELILGEDDTHLNFRVSLFIDSENQTKAHKNLTITTTVNYNNWFGRLYFLPVKPFHRLIVPTMLKEMLKQIEVQNLTNGKL